jgi:uncharacterized protein
MRSWKFYGRRQELADIEAVLARGEFFFCAVSGRRRIGKTTLIQEALRRRGQADALYVQIPDGDERGVIQAFEDGVEDMGASQDVARTVSRSFSDIAQTLASFWRAGVVTVLDEFQYFNRKSLSAFPSNLQAVVDRARSPVIANTLAGRTSGLFTLGSIHTEMTAILEDKASPLFNRVTDRINVNHWDAETLFEVFREHEITDREQQLFLWSIFEGVPKFYRDCFDQGILVPALDYRAKTLRRMFFEGSSPLRDEAENWFLRELRGRYDTVLTLLARKGPTAHGDLKSEFDRTGDTAGTALGGYLQVLVDKYGMIRAERPLFSDKERNVRYVIADNFLSAWLSSIQRHVRTSRIQPIEQAVAKASESLAIQEGFFFEKLVRLCFEECSRKGVGDFALTDLAKGFWDKSNVEIDLIATNSEKELIRFGSCKRSSAAHSSPECEKFEGHIARFFETKHGARRKGWSIQKALYAPSFDPTVRARREAEGYLCYDLATFDTWLKR